MFIQSLSDLGNHYLVPQGLHLPIQNCHRPLDIIHATIILNFLQRNHNHLIDNTLSQLGKIEGLVNLIQLLRQL